MVLATLICGTTKWSLPEGPLHFAPVFRVPPYSFATFWCGLLSLYHSSALWAVKWKSFQSLEVDSFPFCSVCMEFCVSPFQFCYRFLPHSSSASKAWSFFPIISFTMACIFCIMLPSQHHPRCLWILWGQRCCLSYSTFYAMGLYNAQHSKHAQ